MFNPNTLLGPYVSSQLFLVKAVSNLHPGIGRAGDIVDLAVQRDGLGYPIIYSSSLKGALKSSFWHICMVEKNEDKRKCCLNTVWELFGPDPDVGEKFASKVAVLDAILVAFPVRSLEGVYAYATSLLLLKRLLNYIDLAGGKARFSEQVEFLEELTKQVKGEECVAATGAINTLGIESLSGRVIINEDLVLSCTNKVGDGGDFDEKLETISEFLKLEPNRLLVLKDEYAKDALERSIVRVTRVALDREKKTGKPGALWTEEYVPMDTVFATVILYAAPAECGQGGGECGEHTVEARFDEFLSKTGSYLIIGGKETIGRGVVKLIKVNAKGGGVGGSAKV